MGTSVNVNQLTYLLAEPSGGLVVLGPSCCLLDADLIRQTWDEWGEREPLSQEWVCLWRGWTD